MAHSIAHLIFHLSFANIGKISIYRLLCKTKFSYTNFVKPGQEKKNFKNIQTLTAETSQLVSSNVFHTTNYQH
jgi:hypothetical protein